MDSLTPLRPDAGHRRPRDGDAPTQTCAEDGTPRRVVTAAPEGLALGASYLMTLRAGEGLRCQVTKGPED